MPYNYPYGNSQQLNLDWLIESWKEFQTAIENIIAPAYDPTAVYNTANNLVIYDHKMYYNPSPVNVPGEFDPDQWTQITIAEILTA